MLGHVGSSVPELKPYQAQPSANPLTSPTSALTSVPRTGCIFAALAMLQPQTVQQTFSNKAPRWCLWKEAVAGV